MGPQTPIDVVFMAFTRHLHQFFHSAQSLIENSEKVGDDGISFASKLNGKNDILHLHLTRIFNVKIVGFILPRKKSGPNL